MARRERRHNGKGASHGDAQANVMGDYTIVLMLLLFAVIALLSVLIILFSTTRAIPAQQVKDAQAVLKENRELHATVKAQAETIALLQEEKQELRQAKDRAEAETARERKAKEQAQGQAKALQAQLRQAEARAARAEQAEADKRSLDSRLAAKKKGGTQLVGKAAYQAWGNEGRIFLTDPDFSSNPGGGVQWQVHYICRPPRAGEDQFLYGGQGGGVGLGNMGVVSQ